MYGLAEHCGFNDLHDKLIRDRIVVGIRDTALAEKLQMDPKLNLQKAVNAVQQSEAVKSQQATVKGVAKPLDNAIDSLQKADAGKNKQFSSKPPVHKPLSKLLHSKPVTLVLAVDHHQCIHDSNVQQKHYSGKKGHFKSVCRSKHVDDITDNNSDIISSIGELSFIDTVFSEVAIVKGGSQPWTVVLDLCSSQTEFKIDTGGRCYSHT